MNNEITVCNSKDVSCRVENIGKSIPLMTSTFMVGNQTRTISGINMNRCTKCARLNEENIIQFLMHNLRQIDILRGSTQEILRMGAEVILEELKARLCSIAETKMIEAIIRR